MDPARTGDPPGHHVPNAGKGTGRTETALRICFKTRKLTECVPLPKEKRCLQINGTQEGAALEATMAKERNTLRETGDILTSMLHQGQGIVFNLVGQNVNLKVRNKVETLCLQWWYLNCCRMHRKKCWTSRVN